MKCGGCPARIESLSRVGFWYCAFRRFRLDSNVSDAEHECRVSEAEAQAYLTRRMEYGESIRVKYREALDEVQRYRRLRRTVEAECAVLQAAAARRAAEVSAEGEGEKV